MDGNIALKIPAALLVAQFLAGYDLAMFSHPDRDCLYEEARFSCLWEVADVNEMEAQAASYLGKVSLPTPAWLNAGLLSGVIHHRLSGLMRSGGRRYAVALIKTS